MSERDRNKQISDDFLKSQKHVHLADAPIARSSSLRHTEIITLEWNSPSTRIAAAKTDRSLRIWKISDRAALPIVIENVHERSVESISWDPLVDNTLSTVGNDRYIKTWNIITGDLLKQIDTAEKRLFIVQYSPDAQYIVAISKENNIVILDSKSEAIIHKLSSDVDIYSITWSNSSSFLFVGLANGSILVYHLRNDEIELISTLKGHRSSIKSLKFDQRANYLIAGSNEGVISLWSLEDLTLAKTIAEVDEPVYSVDSTSDGTHVGVTFEDGAPLKFYKILDKSEEFEVKKCVSGRQTFPSFKFAPTKPTYAYSTAEGELYITVKESKNGSSRYHDKER